jgi:hypothetical protein
MRWILSNKAVIVGTSLLFDFLQSVVGLWGSAAVFIRFSRLLSLGRKSKYAAHENNKFIVYIF